MRKLTNLVVLAVVAVFSFPAFAQTKPAVKKVEAKKVEVPNILSCDKVGGSNCAEANVAVDEGQDQSIHVLEKQVRALKYAQAKLAAAEDLDSAVDRIAALEEAKNALPEDLVGRSDVEKMLTAAQSKSKEEVNKTLEALRTSFDERITDLETRMDALESRVDDVEDHVGKLAKRRAFFHVFLAGIAGDGTSTDGFVAGGPGVGLMLPLGEDSDAFFLLEAWLGGSTGPGVAWGGKIAVDWWLKWFAIGPALVYSQDEGDWERGVQSRIGGIGMDMRFKLSEKFSLELTPFAGFAGQKPGHHCFGGGATGNLTLTF